jgi:hypothetical protein
LREGGTLKITGIGGDLSYIGHSQFMVRYDFIKSNKQYRNKETKEMEQKSYKNVGMIAAGSGITPMF